MQKKYDRYISFDLKKDVIYIVVTKPLLQNGQQHAQALNLNQIFHTRIIVSSVSFDA